jgi:hypothetical protein
VLLAPAEPLVFCAAGCGRFTRAEDVALIKSSTHRRHVSKEALMDMIADMCAPGVALRLHMRVRVCV